MKQLAESGGPQSGRVGNSNCDKKSDSAGPGQTPYRIKAPTMTPHCWSLLLAVTELSQSHCQPSKSRLALMIIFQRDLPAPIVSSGIIGMQRPPNIVYGTIIPTNDFPNK